MTAADATPLVDVGELAAEAAELRRQLAQAQRERDAAIADATRRCAERDSHRARAAEMHRRAQRLEGIEASVERLRQGHERALRAAWFDRGHARGRLCEQWQSVSHALDVAGHPNEKRPDEREYPSLETRIARLAAERDEARRDHASAVLLGRELELRAQAAEGAIAAARRPVVDRMRWWLAGQLYGWLP